MLVMKKISLVFGIIYILVINTNAQNNKVYYRFPTGATIIYDICFTPDGKAIGIADNKSIKVYSMVTNELIREFRDGHSGQILSIDISNDSTKLVSGAKDSTVVIWDFKEGKLLKSLKCNSIITSVCISPDSQYLAYGGSDNMVFVYDMVNDRIISTFSEHSDDITSIAYSPDGNYIATSSGDKMINIYENGALLTKLSGHKNWVRDISFNSDGTKLISCGDDRKVITWDISDIGNPGIIIDSKHGFDWLLSVDFNQDDKTYAFADFKGNIEISSNPGGYECNIKSPINRILFKPNEGIFLKIAVATRGKGALLIDVKNMKMKN